MTAQPPNRQASPHAATFLTDKIEQLGPSVRVTYRSARPAGLTESFDTTPVKTAPPRLHTASPRDSSFATCRTIPLARATTHPLIEETCL